MSVQQVQCLLLFLGYGLAVDGLMGPITQGAMEAFEREFGVPEGQDIPNALRQAVAQNWQRPEADFWPQIRYFKRSDPYIGCPCGQCGGFPAEPSKVLMVLADRVREHFGVPMIPTSTVRCPDHNKRVGGVSNSRHVKGKAMDFRIPGKSASEILNYVNQQPEARYAYQVNHRVVHMDVN